MMYAIITTFIFAASKPARRTPVALDTRQKLPAALKAAKESVQRHECPYHQSCGMTASLVKDEDENTIGGFVSYRDGTIKELRRK